MKRKLSWISGIVVSMIALSVGVAHALVIPAEQPITPAATSSKSLAVESQASQEVQEVTPEPASQPVQDTPAPAAPQASAVLSSQEYAAIYLDLSGANQGCFDRIVSTWPDRFSEAVREKNVKSLRVWYSVCSSGIDQYRHGTIWAYGVNGEFFDSPTAAQYQG